MGKFWERDNYKMIKKKNNSVLYGILAGVALLLVYLAIVSLFQGVEFAFLNLRSLWYLIFPLAAGFGTQIGLYTSIRHTATITGTAAATGGISAGGMLACCSHFLLNLLPIAGISGLAIFLMEYQPAFLGVGIISNIAGIGLMVKHKKQMKDNLKGNKISSHSPKRQMKANQRFSIKRETHLKGGTCH